MTGGATILFMMLALVLPIMALVARRVPIATVVKLGAVWITIFGVGTLILTAIQ